MTTQTPETSALLYRQPEYTQLRIERNVSDVIGRQIDLTERSTNLDLPFNNRLNDDGDLTQED